MDREETFAFLDAARARGVILGLSNIRNLMGYLGNVQERLRVIHVAGTNGKGSVCAMLASILAAAGYKTGKYASPAVFAYEEIYQINGADIPKERLAEVFSEVKAACEKMASDGLTHPTVFEIETAAAFCYFYEEQCDYVVLETGMGGAEDATNLIEKPVLSVLTSISPDHMAVLGNTLEKIAAAKAGIIKKGRPCVTARQEPEASAVIKKAAMSKNSPLYPVRADTLLNFQYDVSGSRFWFAENADVCEKTQEKGRPAICGYTPLAGAYQEENIACVLTAVNVLRGQGIAISVDALLEGFSRVRLAGRMEQIAVRPECYIDGAHNEGAAHFLEKTVQNCFTNRKIVYIIGVLADKAYEKVLETMLPYAAYAVTVTPQNPRALDGARLAEIVRGYGVPAAAAGDMEDAVRRAGKEAGEHGVVLAFGSLSYLGDLKRAAMAEWRQTEWIRRKSKKASD